MSQTDPSSGQELEAVAARVEAGLARAAFYVLTPWLAMHLICGFIWSRPLAWQGAMAALLALTWWSRRWTASRGLAWGAALLAVFGALHVVELVAELKAPPLAYSAARAGRPIDFRGYFEVFDDEKAAGRVAVPAIMPGGAFQMNHRDFSLDGRGVTPLSGFSNVRTILCAESGTWEFYDSDQHGFNNPPGVWDLPMQVGVVGDSFTQATCVKADENIPALIRQRYPATVNLGMGGNGPMLELAGIKEFLAPRKPRVVLQLYYENDVGNLVEEWSNPNLRAYLTDRNYRVNLLDNQAAVDAWLRGVLAVEDGRAKRWPARLVSVGLTRANTPYWVQDFIEAGDRTLIAGLLRLHKVYALLASRFQGRGATAAADAPPADLLARVLAEARGTVEGWGGRFYLVYIPSYPDLKGTPSALEVHARTLAAARQAGVPVIDLLGDLGRNPNALTEYFSFAFSHYSAGGYRAAAQPILERLERDGAVR